MLTDRRANHLHCLQITLFIIHRAHVEPGGRVLEFIGQAGRRTEVITLNTVVDTAVGIGTHISDCVAGSTCPSNNATIFYSIVGVDDVTDTANANPQLAIIVNVVKRSNANSTQKEGLHPSAAAGFTLICRTPVRINRMTHILLLHPMNIISGGAISRDIIAPLHHLFWGVMNFRIRAVRLGLVFIQRTANLQAGTSPLCRRALAQNAGAYIEVTRILLVSKGIFIISAPVD